jgi:hypothetical protein
MVESILARTDWVQMTRTTSDEPAPNICSAIRTGRFIFFLSVDMYVFKRKKRWEKREAEALHNEKVTRPLQLADRRSKAHLCMKAASSCNQRALYLTVEYNG